ncbi:hypothetical protein RHSIM_Rhsim02G0176700 [Rhododendron simsii]|uniref:Uncharacterized protein n=1 Tax=Rhododendron simsii TaxID=118357 RepID=A0A834LRU3_RHOSS|nr:hypothetical protein RHSIM_Rhsim02G0176700 [Rhododendron simsii]
MDDNVQGNGKNVVIDICDDSKNDDGNDAKRLDELMEEEDDNMTFDMHEDGETFYNAHAKVNNFSIRNYNMHKDNAGIVKLRKWVGIKTSPIMDFAMQQSGGYESVGYMQKELYNHFTAQRNIEVMDGDAEEMDDNVQGNGKNVVIDICDDSKNDDGNDAKRLDELMEEEDDNMTFDMHEDGETFYNAHAKVNNFSIRNYNMHKDNAGIVKLRKWVGIKTSPIMDFAMQQSGGYESVGYMQKDLYNHFTAQRNIEVMDGDAEAYDLSHENRAYERNPLWFDLTEVDKNGEIIPSTWQYTNAEMGHANNKGYNGTKEEITKLTSRMRGLCVLHVEEEQRSMGQNDNVEGTSIHFGVGDLAIIKGKRTHNLAKDFIPKARKYGNCREPGHIRTKCPKLVRGDDPGNMNENENEKYAQISISISVPRFLEVWLLKWYNLFMAHETIPQRY